jgi:calcium-dependent protein kinase
MTKLFSAINYLHNLGIIHRDLKPENIVFKSTNLNSEIKIIDFGLSKKCRDVKAKRSSIIGTPLYAAPETLRGKYSCLLNKSIRHSPRCDEWALGCIMYVLISGEPPFYSAHIGDLYNMIKRE